MKKPQDCKSLGEIRSQIDQLDRSLITTISRRQEYVHAAARFKRSEDQVHARDRQRSMLAARKQWAESAGVDPDLIEVLFRTIVDHFVRAEMAMFSDMRHREADSQTSSSLNTGVDASRSDRADSEGSRQRE